MLVILVQMALLGFLAAGGLLSVVYIVKSAGDKRGFDHHAMPDFESHFRSRLARQKGNGRY